MTVAVGQSYLSGLFYIYMAAVAFLCRSTSDIVIIKVENDLAQLLRKIT